MAGAPETVCYHRLDPTGMPRITGIPRIALIPIGLGMLCSLLAPRPLLAQGYVDPGAGAMIWQILAASFVGAIFIFRRFALRWVKKRRPSVESKPPSGDSKGDSK
jgi:hypothetical protein